MRLVIRIDEIEPCRFRANCPALPGCVVYGRAREEARYRIAAAVAAHLAGLDASLPVNVTGMARLPEGWRARRLKNLRLKNHKAC